jgi:uncharacterized protein (DUF849 family)
VRPASTCTLGRRPGGEAALFEEIVAGIRAEVDVVVNVSTGGAPGMAVEERLGGVRACNPELATLNLGTMNYEGFPTPGRWPKVNTDWEHRVLETSGSGTFVNTLTDLRLFARTARELGVTPELEAYDLGHLSMARFLIDEGTLEGPVRVQLVLGVLGGAGNSLGELFLFTRRLSRSSVRTLLPLGWRQSGTPCSFVMRRRR